MVKNFTINQIGSNDLVNEQEQNRKSLIFSIEDSGIGIKDNEKGKLFEMFGKLSSSESMNP